MRRLAILILLATTPALPAQSIADRLETLEANTAALNALSSRVSNLEAKIDALAAKLEGLLAAKEWTRPQVQHRGYTFYWDGQKYRPEGHGWSWDAPSGTWTREVPQSAYQYNAPVFQDFSGFSSNCQGGSCGTQTAARGRRR